MIKPTEKEIEAAINAYGGEFNSLKTSLAEWETKVVRAMSAALEAAAQVREREDENRKV